MSYTSTNTAMVVVTGPMGVDRAAFAVPADAWAWVLSQGNPPVHYRRPSDGATYPHSGFSSSQDLLAWCLGEG